MIHLLIAGHVGELGIASYVIGRQSETPSPCDQRLEPCNPVVTVLPTVSSRSVEGTLFSMPGIW